MRRLLILLPLLCTGCTLTVYRGPEHSFTRVALGANTQAQMVTIRILPDGTKEVIVGGYAQTQDEAFGAAAEGATNAVIKALSPTP